MVDRLASTSRRVRQYWPKTNGKQWRPGDSFGDVTYVDSGDLVQANSRIVWGRWKDTPDGGLERYGFIEEHELCGV